MKVRHTMSNGKKRKSIVGVKVPINEHTHSAYMVVAKVIKDGVHKICNAG